MKFSSAIIACILLASCGSGVRVAETPVPDSTGRGAGSSSYAAPAVAVPVTPEISRAHVMAYLSAMDSLYRWNTTPVVRPVAGMPDAYRRSLERAVHAVNAALPHNLHLEIGADIARPDGDGRSVPAGALARGTILVDTTPDVRELFLNGVPVGGWTVAEHAQRPAASPGRPRPPGVINSAWITIGRIDEQYGYFEQSLIDHEMLHELVHALGMDGHLYDVPGPLSAIGARIADDAALWEPDLPALDAEALRQHHTLFRIGYFGEWSDTARRITGDIGSPIATRKQPGFVGAPRGASATFGVDYRAGRARPWISGLSSEAPLTKNATWRGELVGFEPDGDGVHGNAEITAIFAGDGLSGSARFDRLAYLADGSAWGDGDLAYGLAFAGAYFRATSGDRGSLHGRVVGERHEGAIGSLERPDLAASFGARAVAGDQ